MKFKNEYFSVTQQWKMMKNKKIEKLNVNINGVAWSLTTKFEKHLKCD